MCIHVSQIIKNRVPALYNSLRHTDNRKYFLGISVTQNQREAHMFNLAKSGKNLEMFLLRKR